MTDVTPQPHSPVLKPGLAETIAKVGPTLFVLAVMASGWLAVHKINTGGQSEEEPATVNEEANPDTLTLADGKVDAAKFESVPAQVQPIAHVHTLPGRIRYDDTKHVDVKAPMDGILAELLVSTGQHVESGQLLAVLRSPEIGQARAEILKRQKEREIAEQVLQREMLLAKNLQEMSAMLDQGQSVNAIENAFRDRAMGSYRQDVLSAYAQVKLSAELLEKVEPLANSGAISGRTIRERQTERQVAENAFRTARDQATYAANQAKVNAEAKLSEADRQLNLAWQAVETLLGYKENRETVNLNDEEALSRLEVRAPFSGSVEAHGCAKNERVMRGDSLIVLANTTSLYVAASIRESDWSAVSLDQNTIVSVSVPALGDRVFEARVRYFGREVQANTNSVPLVATIDNSEGLLRPGMFVRMTIPIGESQEVLSVKPEAVVQHENQSFVFVEVQEGSFKRVDVMTGHSSDDWIEVTNGLSPGQLVVTHGAFLLKSELLLQGEGE